MRDGKNVREIADDEKQYRTRTASRIVELRCLDTALHHMQGIPIDFCQAVFPLPNRESIQAHQIRW